MKSIFKNIKNIAWLCRPYWKYGKIYLVLSVFVFVLRAPIEDYIYVRFPEIVIDSLSKGDTFVRIAVIASIICTVSLSIHILPYIFNEYFTRRQEAIDLKVKRDIYEKARQTDYKYIDNPDYYDNYAWAVNEYANQVGSVRKFINKFLGYFLSISVLIAIMATIGPLILVIEVIQMFLQAVINNYYNKMDIKKKSELVPVNRRLSYYHRLFYMKEYSADIKSTSLSRFVFGEYEQTGREKVDIMGKYARRIGLLIILQETIFCLTEFFIVIYLVHSIIIGNIPEIGMYMTMMLAFYRLDSKLYGLVGMFKEAHSFSLNVDKIRNFFDMKSEIEIDTTESKLSAPDGKFRIDLKNVCFQYENSDFSLEGLNISIKAGEKVAIVGENGAGKSTFVKLLLRLYDVNDGEILINSMPIKDYDIHALRQKIGVAFQNTNIYAMTFAENIGLYNEIDPGEMDKVCNELELHSILEKNCADYNAELTREFDKSGIILSGGEAQKVALARILTGEFGLLLLDEASSALDPIAEYKMTQMILGAANKTTTIMVAHRLSAVRNVDRIILMDGGRISEVGTHDELMNLNGKYYEMFTKQAENYRD